jgi:hypothetical protein
MYCVRNVTEDLYWVGANDHRLTLFENIPHKSLAGYELPQKKRTIDKKPPCVGK